MNGSPEVIDAGYAACRSLARRSRSNFYASFVLLPAEKRRAMEALYAFMRRTDDLADNNRPAADRRRALARWREQLSAALAGAPMPQAADDDDGIGPAILPGVADAVRRFRIPVEHLQAVIDGVEMDVAGRRYETFEELQEYCHRVASAVGLACIHVWGFRGPEAFEPARQCGVAMQLTNILRDLGEDARDGRLYLPLEDFRHCGYTPEELSAGVADERFVRLVRMEIARAERLYSEGARLIDWLAPDGRRVFGLMMAIYHRLLGRIAREPTAPLARQVRLSRWEKLRLAGRWALLPPRRSALP